jgi:hypothetical protein
MKAGDRVVLRSPAEILATLDERGCLDGVPFMPEMLGYFGRPFTVQAQLQRACDTIGYGGVRRFPRTVLLDDLRCDGAAHGGCQAACRVYWKEAWLRLAPANDAVAPDAGQDDARAQLERLAHANVHVIPAEGDGPRFRCQATELVRASEPVGWWSFRSLLREVTVGNVRPLRFVRVVVRAVYEDVAGRLGLFSGMPFRPEELTGKRTPPTESGPPLRPGELVQVRSRSEIAGTLNKNGKNRGLWFDREMLEYCGHSARVRAKIERFVDESTGKLVELASDAYSLEDVVCHSDHSAGRWFCPRAIYPYWRECWLRPLEGTASSQAPLDAAANDAA